MGDVYVEVGAITKGLKITDDQLKAASPAATAALADWIKNTSGVTSTKPKDGAGVKLGVMISEIVKGTDTLSCKVVGSVFNLPKGDRKQISARTIGEGKIAGKKADIASCTTAAVADMMTKIGSGVKSVPLTNAEAKMIYIAPHEITFKTAPQTIVADATPKISAALDALVQADSKYIQDKATAGDAFKDGMIAYKLSVKAGVTVDTKAKTAVISLQCDVLKYPENAMFGNASPATGKLKGDIRDKTIVDQLVEMAKTAGARGLKAIPAID